MKIVNPATEEISDIKTTELGEIAQLLVDRAKQAQSSWASLELAERLECLGAFELSDSDLERIAKIISNDMGKPIASARKELVGSLEILKYYSEHAQSWLAPDPHMQGHIHYQPLGIIAVITPWNFPFRVPLFNIVAPLLAGNAVVFKPSEYSLASGIELAQSLKAVLPNKDLLQTIVGAKEHGQELVKSDIQMVAFTGSTSAGSHIMQACARDIKRVKLELGGMDPAIVLKDADIESSAKAIVRANCVNTGQVCCAAKRVYVEEDIYPAFVQAAVEASKQVSFGDPSTEVDMGPLVAKFQRDKVADIVEDARAQGATVHSGGYLPQGKGYYYPSTIVTDVTAKMRIMYEEPFGPVLPIVPVLNWQDAVIQANDSPYGLTASVWTGDPGGLGQKIAAQLEVGQVGINGHACAPIGAPFGGAKQSGIGRVHGKESMRSYCNTKYIYAI